MATGIEAMERRDGRGTHTLRQMGLDLASLKQADGSAAWRQEGTHVLAAVHGPIEAPPRKENSEAAVVEVVFRPLQYVPGEAEREKEQVIRQTVEAAILGALHPRTTVQVVLQVVSDDGALLACAINAACFALLDAGVPMSRMFMAVGCCVTEGGDLLVDSTKEEEAAATAAACIALEGRPQAATAQQTPTEDTKVMAAWTCGKLSQEQFFQLVTMCRKAQAVIDAFVRQFLTQYYDRQPAATP
mmetsp:Transcript_33780/g.95602  ORF Transcript_33780/g.95602 Transcript_33780/m.95602 type:complete len:244 (-) Transcript_33780:179-910(-)|eukprot:CAMPEP_0117665094 /NCGR_PEP_ID=MMETSP0804-20121206/9613_1 /TAXON_ID=1074897 /ORGANISM="Tetraselmis astigmatica, Strain CCMP880" /LENGTH=243 /DNA_ID=CAMNT_0005472457 /DNA_START=465 /DNA_END=1196 /DNA_ORIENTATION=+